jgi:hypothetical protein
MNKATLSILTAFITLSSVNVFAQNSQTDVDNQLVQQQNQLTEEEYLKLKLLQNNTEAMLEAQEKSTKIQIEGWHNIEEQARKIAGEEITGYEYNYGY